MLKFKLAQFEGPLDLLLQLIEDQKLDVSKVSLATVADQFVQYIDKATAISPEELADFLVVATKLLLIKSKLLVPVLEEDEEEGDLENQLKIYREYLEACKKLQLKIFEKKFLYLREKPPIVLKTIFNPPEGVTISKFKEMFLSIIKSIEPIVILPESIIEKTITLKDKIFHIQNLIKTKAAVSFQKLIEEAKSKTEIIVSFLALLELIKQKEVSVVQDKLFEDIMIKRANKS